MTNATASVHVGETKIMNNGKTAEIIEYRKYTDIDVKFEDGTIVAGKSYSAFKAGSIRYPSLSIGHSEERVGMIREMNNGQIAQIIAYRNNRDIDVEFENGNVVTHKTFQNFIEGRISDTPKQNSVPQIGEKRKMTCGMTAKIIAVHKNKNKIDIKFRNGNITTTTYSLFKKGKVSPMNTMTKEKLDEITSDSDETSEVSEKEQNARLGETAVMNNGQMATIVAYRRSDDIDIMFEDGSIVEHRRYSNFKTGKIANMSSNYIETRRNYVKALNMASVPDDNKEDKTDKAEELQSVKEISAESIKGEKTVDIPQNEVSDNKSEYVSDVFPKETESSVSPDEPFKTANDNSLGEIVDSLSEPVIPDKIEEAENSERTDENLGEAYKTIVESPYSPGNTDTYPDIYPNMCNGAYPETDETEKIESDNDGDNRFYDESLDKLFEEMMKSDEDGMEKWMARNISKTYNCIISRASINLVMKDNEYVLVCMIILEGQISRDISISQEYLIGIMRLLHIDSFDMLAGNYVRIECDGEGNIMRIGHIIYDNWVSFCPGLTTE